MDAKWGGAERRCTFNEFWRQMTRGIRSTQHFMSPGTPRRSISKTKVQPAEMPPTRVAPARLPAGRVAAS